MIAGNNVADKSVPLDGQGKLRHGMDIGANENTGFEQGQESKIANAVADNLRTELGEKVFNSWFAGLRVTSVQDGVAHVTCRRHFYVAGF